ncbi:MAG: pilus assembly FimT family protein [Methylobacter sp.]
MIRYCKGFSLIELVLIIVILSILAVSISARINFASHDATGYAEVVKASIRLAQKLAIAQRQVVNVDFPVNPCNGVSVNGLRVTGESCRAVPNNVAVTPFALSFNGLGQPNVNVVTAINVSGGDVSRTICLEPETGYVHEEAVC